MSKNQSFDPVATWQEMLQKWEIEINNWSGKLTESEQFGAIMGQATKMNLAAQKAIGDQTEQFLRSMNLPSKSQIDGLAERMDAIEESLDRLRLAIEQKGSASNPTPQPKRTRKPVDPAA